VIAAISTFFQKHLGGLDPAANDIAKTQSTRLAAAALLIEVVRADTEFTQDERRVLMASVRNRFSLDAQAADELLALAEQETKDAVDLYQFTSQINQHFTPDQKKWLIEELWRAAYADKILDRHEESIVRKVAELLYVPNLQVLAAKHRVAQEAAQQAD
jgi:uncharacterized tellurite resistance protein B-like protein